MIEEQRTNLVLRSSELDNGVWLRDNAGTGVAPTVTANFATAPDGNMAAERVQLDKGAGVGFSRIAFNYASGSAINHVCSAWMKTNDASTKQVAIRIHATASTVTVTGTWQRFSVAGLSTVGPTGCQILLWDAMSTSNTADLLVWGVQLEHGAFITSYIPTVAATVTRNADLFYIPTGAWFSSSSGTIMSQIDYVGVASGSIGGAFALNDNTTQNRVDYRAGQSQAIFSVGGVDTLISPLALSGGVVKKVADTYSASIAASSIGGNAAISGTPRLPTGVNRLWIGSIDTGCCSLNGHVSLLKYYPLSITTTQLQLMTQ